MRPDKYRTARKAETRDYGNKPFYAALGIMLGLAVLMVAHTPYMIYQIRKPVYEATCEVGKKQDYVLHMVGSHNLTADKDAEMLAAVRIASGNGSVPIQELRVTYNGVLIDLGEHPSWERLIEPLQIQDSVASLVVMHNISYCNMPAPWTIWPKRKQSFRFPVEKEPETLEVAEVSG
jgi:hypothetical protein